MRQRASVHRLIAPGVLAALVLAGCPGERPGPAASPPSGSTPATEPRPDEPAPPIALDLSRDGVHRSGPWEYRFRITAKGTRSEGERGELFFDGQPVPPAVQGDYHVTPWGDLLYVGDPEVLWGPHGWMPREPGSSGGRRLDPP